MNKAILLCVAILMASACFRIDLQDELAKQDVNAWLTKLDDSTPLVSLSIPGAHDAASSTINVLPHFTRTQELNISEQWARGVRAFDLRPAWKDGTLGIYHDRFDAQISFQHIINTLFIALGRNPGEFAIVLVRHEQEADENDPDWPSAMGQYLGSAKDNLIDYNPSLTLGDMRGKILILSRNEYDGGPYGGYIKDWNHGADIGGQKKSSIMVRGAEAYFPVWIQDYYDPATVEDKWVIVKTMLDATTAAADSDTPPLVINHASGYIGGNLPDYRSNARSTNAKIADYLATSSAPVGIIMMDYAGAAKSSGVSVYGDVLLDAIIKHNKN